MKNKLENFKSKLHILSLKQQSLIKGGDGPTLPDRNVVDWNTEPNSNLNYLYNIQGYGEEVVMDAGQKHKLYIL